MIEHANHIWAEDAGDIPTRRGLVNLAAAVDAFRRPVPAHRVSITI
jgi:hypothetical protein